MLPAREVWRMGVLKPSIGGLPIRIFAKGRVFVTVPLRVWDTLKRGHRTRAVTVLHVQPSITPQIAYSARSHGGGGVYPIFNSPETGKTSSLIVLI